MSGAVSAVVAGSMLASAIGTTAATLVVGGLMGAGLGAVSAAITGGDIGQGALWGGLGGAVTAGVGSALGGMGMGTETALGAGARGALSGAAGGAVAGRGDPTTIATGGVLGGIGGYMSGPSGGTGAATEEGSTGMEGASEGSQYAADSAAQDAAMSGSGAGDDQLSGILSRAQSGTSVATTSEPSMLDKMYDSLGLGSPTTPGGTTDMTAQANNYVNASPQAQVAADVSGAVGGSAQVAPPSLMDKAIGWASENPLKAATVGLTGVQTLSQLADNADAADPTGISPQNTAANTLMNAPLDQYTNVTSYTPYKGDLSKYGSGPEYLQYLSSLQKVAKGGVIKPSSSPLRMAGAFSDDGQVYGDGAGQDDVVPALLSAEEYVVPADCVAHLGDGSSTAGGKRLDKFVASIRQHKASGKGQPPKAKDTVKYLKSARA